MSNSNSLKLEELINQLNNYQGDWQEIAQRSNLVESAAPSREDVIYLKNGRNIYYNFNLDRWVISDI